MAITPFTRETIQQAIDELVDAALDSHSHVLYWRAGNGVDTFRFANIHLDGFEIEPKIMIRRNGIQEVVIKGVVPCSIGDALAPMYISVSPTVIMERA